MAEAALSHVSEQNEGSKPVGVGAQTQQARLLTWNINGLRKVAASHGGLKPLLDQFQMDIGESRRGRGGFTRDGDFRGVSDHGLSISINDFLVVFDWRSALFLKCLKCTDICEAKLETLTQSQLR